MPRTPKNTGKGTGAGCQAPGPSSIIQMNKVSEFWIFRLLLQALLFVEKNFHSEDMTRIEETNTPLETGIDITNYYFRGNSAANATVINIIHKFLMRARFPGPGGKVSDWYRKIFTNKKMFTSFIFINFHERDDGQKRAIIKNALSAKKEDTKISTLIRCSVGFWSQIKITIDGETTTLQERFDSIYTVNDKKKVVFHLENPMDVLVEVLNVMNGGSMIKTSPSSASSNLTTVEWPTFDDDDKQEAEDDWDAEIEDEDEDEDEEEEVEIEVEVEKPAVDKSSSGRRLFKRK
jgi:hypothetical protein